MNEEIYQKLGASIKKRRSDLNLTQQELADKVGKSLNFIGKVEVAFSKPSFNTIIEISKALDISLKNLFDFENL